MGISTLFQGCCSQVGGNGAMPMYRQARLLSSGALVNLWLDVSKIPTVPPAYIFYNPADGLCYEILATDAPSATPGTILSVWQGTTDSGIFALLCGTHYAEARDCDGVLMGLWKALSSITLPYTFITSGGVCGIIDNTSPQSSSAGTLLTGETATGGCTDTVCNPTTFSYDSGRVSSLSDGGSSDLYTSVDLSINTTGFTHINFGSFSCDDFAFIIKPAETCTTSRSGGSSGLETITCPADALVFAANSGDLSPDNQAVVTNGTITAQLGTANTDGFTGNDPTTFNGVMVSKGFTEIVANTTYPLTMFSAFIGGDNIMRFKIAMTPVGVGNITISGVTLS